MHTKQFSSAQPIVPTLCVSEVGVSHRVLCTPSQHAWPGRPRGERTEMSRLGNLRHTLSPCCRKRDCPMGCTASAAAAVPAGEREIEPRKGGHGNTRIRPYRRSHTQVGAAPELWQTSWLTCYGLACVRAEWTSPPACTGLSYVPVESLCLTSPPTCCGLACACARHTLPVPKLFFP